MILAIDIGNTNIVIGGLEYMITLKNLFEINNIDFHGFDGGIISSVVPPVTPVVKEAMERLVNKKVLVVGPGVKTGLNILLDNPSQLGSDRVADAVAAYDFKKSLAASCSTGNSFSSKLLDVSKTKITALLLDVEISDIFCVVFTSRLTVNSFSLAPAVMVFLS